MITRRSSTARSFLALLVLVAGLLSVFRLATIAADDKPQADASSSANEPDNKAEPSKDAAAPTPAKPVVALTRNSPKSTADLEAIQAAIQQAAAKGLPATVGISISGSFGSGVIVSEDGYVLTAGHVLMSPGRTAWVIFPDGKHVKAKTLGVNRDMDSGMLKITEEGKYPFVELGHSRDLKLGQWCVTLGHPGGFIKDRPPVVRAGRVLYNREDAIGTDCTIVGGDSGGPLLDTNGRLIGIHSRISDGVTDNYHVPIDAYRDTWDRLVKGDNWGREPTPSGPLLGINGRDVEKGCRITDVFPGTPASRIGLTRDDVIMSLNGESVTGLKGLQNLIAKRNPGDEVTLEIDRAGEKKELKVRLMDRD